MFFVEFSEHILKRKSCQIDAPYKAGRCAILMLGNTETLYSYSLVVGEAIASSVNRSSLYWIF